MITNIITNATHHNIYLYIFVYILNNPISCLHASSFSYISCKKSKIKTSIKLSRLRLHGRRSFMFCLVVL